MYKIEDIKNFFDEANRKINDGVKKANEYWHEHEDENGYIPNFEKEKAKEIQDKAKKEAWDECFSKLEETYPQCLSNKDFARFFADNGSLIAGISDAKTYFYDRFSGEGQIGLIEKFDFHDYNTIFPELMEVLKNDIISSSDYEKLGLKEDEEIEMSAFVSEKEDKNGEKVYKEGVILNITSEVWDEITEQFQQEFSEEGMFLPFDNFTQAELIGNSDSKLAEVFENMVENLKKLPYQSMIELLESMKLLPDSKEKENQKDEHEISEIFDTVVDRKVSDVSKTIDEITKNIKEKTKENGQTKDN